MKKLLFMFPFILIFAVSCGESKDAKMTNETSQETSDTGSENGAPDNSDTADSQSNDPVDTTDTSDISDTSDTTDTSDMTDTSDSSDTSDSGDPADSGETPAETTEKYCVIGCTTASDCVTGTDSNALFDADNYKCDSGKCIYLGCLSDAECDEVYGAVTQATGRVYRCNKNGAYGYPECTPTCSNVADCNLYGEGSTQYAYDLDNNKCENGLCVYTGCLSDAECEATTYSDLYKCLPQEYSGKTLKICTVACQTADDCQNSGLYDCKDSVCVMKRCESDEWCRKYDEDYVCR
jgi:hypothetical protein